MTTNLDSHGIQLLKWAEEKGWNDDRSFGEHIALMHSELSEALEEYRNGNKVQDWYWKEGKPEGVPIELADVIIRIMLFCAKNGISIDSALNIKMEYNNTRPYRHGGKVI